jgi:hypothetical protein
LILATLLETERERGEKPEQVALTSLSADNNRPLLFRDFDLYDPLGLWSGGSTDDGDQ